MNAHLFYLLDSFSRTYQLVRMDYLSLMEDREILCEFRDFHKPFRFKIKFTEFFIWTNFNRTAYYYEPESMLSLIRDIVKEFDDFKDAFNGLEITKVKPSAVSDPIYFVTGIMITNKHYFKRIFDTEPEAIEYANKLLLEMPALREKGIIHLDKTN